MFLLFSGEKMPLTHANRDLFVGLAFKNRLEELAPVAHIVRQGICELAPIPIIDLMPISALERLVSGGLMNFCKKTPCSIFQKMCNILLVIVTCQQSQNMKMLSTIIKRVVL